MTSVETAAGPRRAAATALPVNDLGGGRDNIGGAAAGPIAGSSSRAAGERPRWGPGRPG